ncbi:MAG: hypothetical protein MUC74_09860 [Ideonella sp.]|nr:hypothetical protein [Ideonella sp.]
MSPRKFSKVKQVQRAWTPTRMATRGAEARPGDVPRPADLGAGEPTATAPTLDLVERVDSTEDMNGHATVDVPLNVEPDRDVNMAGPDAGAAMPASAPPDAVTHDDETRAVAAPREAVPMVLRQRLPVGQILLQAGRLAPDDIDAVLEQQRSDPAKFGQIVVSRGLADMSDVLWALAQQTGAAQPAPQAESIGFSEELVVARNPHGPAAEVIRALAAQLLGPASSLQGAARRPLAFVSADVGDGKSYLVANLAILSALSGSRVAVVDADLRSPRQHQLLMSARGSISGLAQVLTGEQLLRDVIMALPDLPNLHLLPAGAVPGSPVELLQRPGLDLLLRGLATVALARKGRTRMEDVHAGLSRLQRSGVTLAGLVMNSH